MSSAPHQPTAPANPRLIDPGHVARVRIAIVGTRGIPARYAGFETFAAQVFPLLVTENGLELTVIGDATCQSHDQMVAPVRSISP